MSMMISSFKSIAGAEVGNCIDLLARFATDEVKNSTFRVFGSRNGFTAEILCCDVVLAAFILTEKTHPGFQAVAKDFCFHGDVNSLKRIKDQLSKLGPTSALTINVYPNPEDGKESVETAYKTDCKGKDVATLTWKCNVETFVDPHKIPDVFGQHTKVTVEVVVFKKYLIDACEMPSCRLYMADRTLHVAVQDGGLFGMIYEYEGKEPQILKRSEWKISEGCGKTKSQKCSFTLFSIWTLVDWALQTNKSELELCFPTEAPAYAKAGEVIVFQSDYIPKNRGAESRGV